ncbi:Uncharacterized membrane protein [Spirosomataceae bacterium TFI 002]|nr:Uncharacterized membrane protein [Spirosomataceae bacterium TFI 002]
MLQEPIVTNDAILLGILLVFLFLIFWGSKFDNKWLVKIFSVIPALLLCYLIPGLLNSFNIISGDNSDLYRVTTNYLLPAALILLTSTANIRAILGLGKTALLTFLSGTVGIIIGGPLALFIVMKASDSFAVQVVDMEYWKGLITVTGSWIGGSSSQLALKEVYGCSEELFAIILVLDAIVANIWTAVLIYGAGIHQKIDKWLKADSSAIEDVKQRILAYKEEKDKPADLLDLSLILAVGFGGAALAHALSFGLSEVLTPFKSSLEAYGLEPFTSKFLWLILLSTTIGIGFSFTKLRSLEKLGSSDIATLMIYFLIMTIGTRLNLFGIGANGGLLLVIVIWMFIHIAIMLVTARVLKAPFFFVAVGSQANIGGVATAPAVASVFHPSLAPVGVLLAVLSHILGTYGGIITAWLMSLFL